MAGRVESSFKDELNEEVHWASTISSSGRLIENLINYVGTVRS